MGSKFMAFAVPFRAKTPSVAALFSTVLVTPSQEALHGQQVQGLDLRSPRLKVPHLPGTEAQDGAGLALGKA